ncbi:MAG: hypothetical protein AAF222_05990 [Pseudomonadota bacterium]
MRCAAFLFFAFLAGCSDWPDAGGPTMARRAQDWPTLRPIDDLINSGQLPAARENDADRLRNRALSLRARAAILRGNASDLEELRARLR